MGDSSVGSMNSLGGLTALGGKGVGAAKVGSGIGSLAGLERVLAIVTRSKPFSFMKRQGYATGTVVKGLSSVWWYSLVVYRNSDWL